ncbi:MAG: hypothetical protein A2X48_23880 [Lentisphaerae bacterium GWF2_49_21]|nr:MAG: hypothetical protein A2X48_23880 [Lentisphaerae bacterium GWF2_49_21]
MSDMIMNYFDDITFISGQNLPECKAVIDGRFQDMFNLQFILSGRMYLGIDGDEKVILDRPAVFWHHPKHSYQYGPASPVKSWHHHWVTFRGPRGKLLMEQGFMKLSPKGFVYVSQPIAYEDTFKRLLELLEKHDNNNHPETVILMEQLLSLLITNKMEEVMDSMHEEAIDRTVSKIRTAPFAEYDFAMISRSMGLSYSHFRRLFRMRMQTAPYDFILNCRMQSAAKSLGDPSKQVKDVAMESGFSDPAQFSKLFRSQIGLSPANYRRTLFK